MKQITIDKVSFRIRLDDDGGLDEININGEWVIPEDYLNPAVVSEIQESIDEYMRDIKEPSHWDHYD